MKRYGFALIELILVIGIIGAVSGMAVPLYRDYQIRNDLNLATEQVTQGLARARLLSQSGQEDDGWGFYVPAGVLYKGEAYGTRDEAFDEVFPMPSTITTTGLSEVAYGKINGQPSTTGAITLTALNKEQRTVLIQVETERVSVVDSDHLTICHQGGGSHTLTVSESAWPAHRDSHGDTLGPCEEEIEASSSSTVSSVASSVASSSVANSVSSAASSAGGATCADRFSIAADGTITTTGPLSVRFDSLGAQFAYGNGGPTVPVTVKYRKKNSGSWSNLFSGNAINTAGATQTIAGFQSGDKVIVNFRGYYKKSGWLTYDNTVYSNDGSKNVLILRNGDTAPTITGSNGQQSVSTLLQSVTTSGKISIGTYDAVLLADFNRASCSSCSNNYCSNCTGVDYQDGIVLVKFLTPSC
jgi:Tfp pilus assembly major pilin PilA